MALKMTKLLTLASILGFVESEDWCSLIQPNGSYNGLGISEMWTNLTESHYIIFNRAGHMWKFDIDISGGVPQNISIKMMPKSVETTDPTIIHRFGGPDRKKDSWSNCVG